MPQTGTPPPKSPALRKGVLAVADQVVYGAANFVATILIARGAGASELGAYSLGLSLALVALDLQNSLILIPYTVYSPRLAGRRRARFGGGALLQTLALGALALAVLGGLGAAPAGLGLPAAVRGIAPALALAVPLLLLRQHARMAAFAHLEFGAALGLDLAASAVQVGGLGLLFYAHALGSASRALGVAALACAAGFAVWWPPRRGALEARPARAAADFARNWRFSKWLAATTPLAVGRSQLCLWLLTAFHGTGPAGFYAACAMVTSLVNPLLTGVNNMVGARAAHLRAEEGTAALRGFILRATALLGAATGLFFLTILAGGGVLIRMIYGPGYGRLGAVLTLMAGSVFVNALAAPAYRGLLALERSGAALVTELLMLVAQLTFGVWLVARWALPGAALAILLASALGTVYQFTVFWVSSGAIKGKEEAITITKNGHEKKECRQDAGATINPQAAIRNPQLGEV